MKSRASLVLALIVCAMMPGRSDAGGVSIQDLGTLFPNSNITSARGLSNSGVIVGFSQTSGGFAYPFRWESGVMTNIGGSVTGSGQAANTAGQVVGYTSGPGPVRAFLYSAGAQTNLGTLPGGGDSQAFGINNVGLIVGGARAPDGNFRAAIFQGGGVVTSLGTLGGSDSFARGVNNSGQIVGNARNTGGNQRAFLYQNGTMTTLGSLGGITSVAEAINDSGVIVGEALLVNGQERGFTYQNGVVTAIGTFGGDQSQALAINSLGQVVGWARDADTNPRAFLYQAGVLTDLNSFLPAGSGWTRLQVAYGINDNGWIVGEGLFGGSRRAFLLVVPAPSGAVALVIGLLFASQRRRR